MRRAAGLMATSAVVAASLCGACSASPGDEGQGKSAPIPTEVRDDSTGSIETPFSRLAGSRWEATLGTGAIWYEFRWGPAREFFIAEGYAEWSHGRSAFGGIWYRHPKERTIKGFAIDYQYARQYLDYATRIEADSLSSEVHAYRHGADEEVFTESWTFTDDTHLVMTRRDGQRVVQSTTFTRVDR